MPRSRSAGTRSARTTRGRCRRRRCCAHRSSPTSCSRRRTVRRSARPPERPASRWSRRACATHAPSSVGFTNRGYGGPTRPIGVIASGERWPDGTLRPCCRRSAGRRNGARRAVTRAGRSVGRSRRDTGRAGRRCRIRWPPSGAAYPVESWSSAASPPTSTWPSRSMRRRPYRCWRAASSARRSASRR